MCTLTKTKIIFKSKKILTNFLVLKGPKTILHGHLVI